MPHSNPIPCTSSLAPRPLKLELVLPMKLVHGRFKCATFCPNAVDKYMSISHVKSNMIV